MSLFGDEDEDGFGTKSTTTSTASKSQSRSLFDDDAPAAATKSASSLFVDDDDGANDSPWGMPTPKKGGNRSAMVKGLLPPSAVPESYVDAFDAILNAGERSGSKVSAAGVQKVLQGSNLPPGEVTRLLGLVAPGASAASPVDLDRAEFNVLLALVGLAQEGDEATLDSVDERRKSTFLASCF